MTTDEINNLKAICLANALNPDFEFVYRRICRWYSKEYSTPLPDVEAMAAESVLKHYFENWFDGLVTSKDPDAKDELDRLKVQLVGTTEDLEEDDKWEEEMLAKINAENGKDASAKPNESTEGHSVDPPNLEDIEENFGRDFEDTYEG